MATGDLGPTGYMLHHLQHNASGKMQSIIDFSVINYDTLIFSILMLVLGLGNTGLPNERWKDNLSLALKLQATLEGQAPGICRPISLRSQRFNQDLAPHALLAEVGAAGDSHEEALVAAEQLAKALAVLKYGTE